MKEDATANTHHLLLDNSGSNLDDFDDETPIRQNRPHRKKHHPVPQSYQSGPTEICIDVTLGRSHQPARFCSRSEAVCAELLRRFVPHFKVQEGVTFQVPIGEDGKGNIIAVDFLVDGVLFEYHPVRFFQNRRRCGDFSNKEEYRTYTKVFHSLNSDKREFFHSAMRARLTQNYFNKRRGMLDQHPLFRRTELIVATTPEEFYERIIRRFGKDYPRNAERFINLFEELVRTLP